MGLIQIGLLFKCFSNAKSPYKTTYQAITIEKFKKQTKKTDYIRILPVRYFRLTRKKHAKIFGLYYKPIYICIIFNHPQKNI